MRLGGFDFVGLEIILSLEFSVDILVLMVSVVVVINSLVFDVGINCLFDWCVMSMFLLRLVIEILYWSLVRDEWILVVLGFWVWVGMVVLIKMVISVRMFC